MVVRLAYAFAAHDDITEAFAWWDLNLVAAALGAVGVDLLKELLNITTVTKSTWSDIIEDEIMELPAVVTARSGILDLTIAQILGLKKGDILELSYDPNSPLKVLVEDQVKFTAIPGTHNGRKAISLSGIDN